MVYEQKQVVEVFLLDVQLVLELRQMLPVVAGNLNDKDQCKIKWQLKKKYNSEFFL